MLILTRKKNETIHIGDQITITIVRVSGNSVRIGVTAPRDTGILRMELQSKRGLLELERNAKSAA